MEKTTLTAIIATVLLISCQSSEIANSKDVNPETIYITYNVNYNEGDETVHCNATFRFGGNKGTTLVLTKPSKIELDGESIAVDSSKFLGAYYQANKSFATFTGRHTWSFTNINHSSLKENFIFKPFSLANPIPSSIHKKDLTLVFNGLDNGSKIDITISDTAAKTDNISRVFTVQNNQVTINATELVQLKNGPLDISISSYSDSPLQESTKEGGRIFMRYTLKPRKTSLLN